MRAVGFGCLRRRGSASPPRTLTPLANILKPVPSVVPSSTGTVTWLDFIGEEKDGKVYIRAGIAKRDGKKLVWVWDKEWRVADPKDILDWDKRPKSFDVKKDDPYEKKHSSAVAGNMHRIEILLQWRGY
jgi:hypothetical protein